jgi:transposase-like protein
MYLKPTVHGGLFSLPKLFDCVFHNNSYASDKSKWFKRFKKFNWFKKSSIIKEEVIFMSNMRINDTLTKEIQETLQKQNVNEMVELLHRLNHIFSTDAIVVYKRQQQDSDYYSVKDVAEIFGVSPQAVYKWIDQGKIQAEEEYTPGAIKNRSKKIPKAQFEQDTKFMKKLDQFKKINELQKEINWSDSHLEDFFPVGNDEDQMRELDIK